MSGASSAYSNGYIGDRQRDNIKKRDLDISELIDLCSKPVSQEDRIKTIREYSLLYPELKLFLIVAYFCKDAFSQINKIGPIQYTPSKTPKGASPETLKSMWIMVSKMYDTHPSGPRVKRGRAQQLLESLNIDDAILIGHLIAGNFYSKELNEEVVALAFPEGCPKDPKV